MEIKSIAFENQEFQKFKISHTYDAQVYGMSGDLTAQAPPRPQLIKAAKACARAVLSDAPMLESEFYERYEMKKVHFKFDGDLVGAIFTVSAYDIINSSPFNFNTRLRYYNQQSKTPELGFSEEDAKAIRALHEECARYIKKDVPQMDLFEEKVKK